MGLFQGGWHWEREAVRFVGPCAARDSQPSPTRRRPNPTSSPRPRHRPASPFFSCPRALSGLAPFLRTLEVVAAPPARCSAVLQEAEGKGPPVRGQCQGRAAVPPCRWASRWRRYFRHRADRAGMPLPTPRRGPRVVQTPRSGALLGLRRHATGAPRPVVAGRTRVLNLTLVRTTYSSVRPAAGSRGRAEGAEGRPGRPPAAPARLVGLAFGPLSFRAAALPPSAFGGCPLI